LPIPQTNSARCESKRQEMSDLEHKAPDKAFYQIVIQSMSNLRVAARFLARSSFHG
jgi:hypothetical protein